VKDGCTLLENQAISEMARARCTGSLGMSCGAYLAAMKSRIAVFSTIVPSSITSAGTRPRGLTLRYSGVFCSFLAKASACESNLAPLSSSPMWDAVEHAPGA
jgi:hypothetical protein